MDKTDLLYSKDHVWVKKEDKSARLGLTGYAQELIGKIQNIEFARGLKTAAAGQPVATVEGQKSIFDILSPVNGALLETNEALRTNPDLVNSDPYGSGWFVRIALTDESELDGLLGEDNYFALIEER
jgi:glycine cleavage system H protein